MPGAAATARTQPTRPRRNPGTKEKRKLYQFGQPSTKKFGRTGSQVPVPQQLRIIEKYMRGTSIRHIAEEEDRARQTVTKIVRAPEVQSYIEKLREEVMALGDEMVKSVRFALRHELDGRLAHEMLKDIGVIQPRTEPWSSQCQPTQEKWTEEWTRRLNLMALDRSEVYGTKVPPVLRVLAGSGA